MKVAHSLFLVLLSALLSGVRPDSAEDAIFKRRSSTFEAEVLSKQVAKQVECEVCVLAAKLIAQHLQERTFKTEPELLEVIEALCKGKPGLEPIDRELERAGWAIEGSESTGFKLVQRDQLNSETATLHKLESQFTLLQGGEESLGQHKRDTLQEACMLSVGEHQSELSEYLFTRLKRKTATDDKVVAQKLCLELSGACYLKKPNTGDEDPASDIEGFDASMDDDLGPIDIDIEFSDDGEGDEDEEEDEEEHEKQDDDPAANEGDMEDDVEEADSDPTRPDEFEESESFDGPDPTEEDDDEEADHEEDHEQDDEENDDNDNDEDVGDEGEDRRHDRTRREEL